MTIDPTTSLEDLAFIVGTALDHAGVSAILSGGGAATVCAPEANALYDLDFILAYWTSSGVSVRCVGPGLPPGPLMTGEEPITVWSTLRRGDQSLQILTPTDCVRDRLSWFLVYGNVDYAALEQALAVADRHDVDLDSIE